MDVNTDNKSLIIFARAPVPGQVKTRLCPPLTPVEAARLHAAFIKDTLGKAINVAGCRVTLAYTPDGSLSHFRDIVGGNDIGFLQQSGADLGARMLDAFVAAFGSGATKAAIVGTDIPTLPPELLAAAFEMLDSADAVFAPTLDGGYCIVALNRPEERLFTGIEWSTPDVLTETLGRAEELGLKVSLLPAQRDVDTPEDLSAIMDAQLPPATSEALGRLRGRIAAG